jgi:hypothetical protein
MAKKIPKNANGKASNGVESPPQSDEEKEQRREAKEEAARKLKRGIAATVEVPSIIVPGLIWLGVLLVGYAVSQLDHRLLGTELDTYMIYATGLATVLMFSLGPLYRNARQLRKPFAKAIVGVGTAIAVVGGAFAIYSGANFGQPVAQGTVLAGPTDTKNLNFQVPGKHYRLFLHGQFPEMDKIRQEAEAAAAKGDKTRLRSGAYRLSGAYAVQLRTADGQKVLETYDGKFEQERTYRKLSKKARGYLDVVKTSILNDLTVPAAGEYQLQVVTLGDQLEPKIEFAVYPKRQFPWLFMLLGLVFTFLYGLIDTLIKPLRVDSYFAITIGLLYGFLAYFVLTAMPHAPYSLFAFGFMVGGLFGAGVAYGIFLLSGKLYARINKRFQLSLG